LDRTAIKDGEEIVESLKERIVGRFTLERSNTRSPARSSWM
jgi:hypothetical protein